MRAAISKAEIESEVSSRFSDAFKVHERRPVETLSTGIPEIDAFTGGLPRGSITEIFGPASSGRTSFILSSLAHATTHDEVCVVVDANNVFDPRTAARAEVNLDHLLWVRCNHNLEHAFKATDLLLQAGGFGLVILDLGDVPAQSAKRIISSWWFRFRRTLEASPTVLLVITEESCVGSRAALGLELSANDVWSSTESQPVDDLSTWHGRPARAPRPRWPSHDLPHSNLLTALSFQAQCRRPLFLNANREVRVQASFA